MALQMDPKKGYSMPASDGLADREGLEEGTDDGIRDGISDRNKDGDNEGDDVGSDRSMSSNVCTVANICSIIVAVT